MLTIRIVTIHGETVQLDVQQVEFVRHCRGCSLPFKTIDVDQLYCDPETGRCKQKAYYLRKKLSVLTLS